MAPKSVSTLPSPVGGTSQRRVPSFRLLRHLIGLALVALCLTAPAAAWNMHKLAHGGCPVALDAHHHHADGRIVMEDGGSPADDGRQQGSDHGHDHMLSMLGGICGTLPEAISLASPVIDSMDPPSPTVRSLADRIEAPPPRPPRSA